jgi:hypothetical protein
MEEMLSENFDGRRFEIQTSDSKTLDCMFFPFNDEEVLTVKEINEKKILAQLTDPPEYLKYPTVIFFNPNA